jgi:hypothetical protein
VQRGEAVRGRASDVCPGVEQKRAYLGPPQVDGERESFGERVGRVVTLPSGGANPAHRAPLERERTSG